MKCPFCKINNLTSADVDGMCSYCRAKASPLQSNPIQDNTPIFGWQCPRCKRCFSPYITECPNCSAEVIDMKLHIKTDGTF